MNNKWLQRFTWVSVVLCGLGFLVTAGSAAEADQTLALKYGWNAVWMEVGPVNDKGEAKKCSEVFKSNDFVIDRVASPIGRIGTAEFTSDPESLFNQGGWDVWVSNPESGESDEIAVRADHAYLVHVVTKEGTQNGQAAGGLSLRGTVGFYRPEWAKGSFNLVGFSVQGAPTFASLMAGSGIVVDGPPSEVPNLQSLNPATGGWQAVKGADVVESGRAYWINVPYTFRGAGWSGPVETDFPGAVTGSLGFGSGPGSLTVVMNPVDPESTALLSPAELTFSSLEKTGGAAHQVTMIRLAPAGPDPGVGDLGFHALEPVPQSLRWTTRAVDFLDGWEAAGLDPGKSRSVTVGVRRNWTTGLNFREHLYRIRVSLDGGSVYRYLPVTAIRPDLPSDATETAPANAFTGLWFGQIVLGNVTSLGNAGAPVQPTPSQLAMQIFIHVDEGGLARLVPRSILMQTKTASEAVEPSQVLVVNEERIPFFEGVQQRADGLRVGLRLETVSYDLPRDLRAAGLPNSLRDAIATSQGVANAADVTDENVSAYFSLGTRTGRPPDLPERYYVSWPLEGQLGVGRALQTAGASPLTLDAFHRSNPFRHAFHPQHGAGYAVTRSFTVKFEAEPDPTILTGTYEETTRGLARQDIVSRGSISLRRITKAATLQ